MRGLTNKFQTALKPIHSTEKMKHNICTFVHDEFAKRQRKSRISLHYTLVCCVMLAIIICGVGSYNVYTTPVSYISVDVNPSVELGLNHLDRVVTVDSYNEDGALVIQNLSLKNKPYTEAVELLLADETFISYLSEDELLSFTVVSDKKDTLLSGIQQCKGFKQNSAECRGSKPELMEEAHLSGLSFGKYQAFLELSQYNSSVTPEDCVGLSMRQIRNLINQYTNDKNSDNPPNWQGQGKGYGRRGGNGCGMKNNF